MSSMGTTYQPHKKSRKTTHGFRARTLAAVKVNGKSVLARRRAKGRKTLCA